MIFNRQEKKRKRNFVKSVARSSASFAEMSLPILSSEETSPSSFGTPKTESRTPNSFSVRNALFHP